MGDIQQYNWGDIHVRLAVPQPVSVMQEYKRQKLAKPNTPFPYWTQVWPAALALCRFLVDNPHYTAGKKVLELAAGLGLPSLVAAHFAQRVICSDYLAAAVEWQADSIAQNGLTNMETRILDWHHLPTELEMDVLLLSDVNYDRSEFPVLETVIQQFLLSNTTVIISTPQRLVAKQFIENILPWAVCAEERLIDRTPVSIYVLQRKA